MNCAASGSCPFGPDCAPWEEPLLAPLSHCVAQCDTRCALDCDCYVALGPPDGSCGVLKKAVWLCSKGTCTTECREATATPYCHGDNAMECTSSSDCGKESIDTRNYCTRPPGMCADADKGTCTRVKPSAENCPTEHPGVCGCDGKIYGNLCLAAVAGVSVRGPASMCPVPVGN